MVVGKAAMPDMTSSAGHQHSHLRITRRRNPSLQQDMTLQATIDTPVANTLMAALPSDLRVVLRLWNRYVDYKGNRSNTDANCSTATVDALSLLAEFEVFGSRTHAN